MESQQSTLEVLSVARAAGYLSKSAVENIRQWLTQPYFQEYVPQVLQHIQDKKWSELEEAFWTTIPFGTGGRRGRMYPIGCNAINDRTIGETAQGLADYVRSLDAPARDATRPLSCAIAYDTRHCSRHFAELCAEIMVAAGFTVHFLDGFRSTPELSFAVRFFRCDCGIIITASHNPPSDNAVKVYGPGGCQYVPPHDAASIDRMRRVAEIQRTPFAEALADGRITYDQEAVDAAFIRAVLKQSLPGPRNLKILYSPLHGVGASAVVPVLGEAGFRNVEIFGPHAVPDGDFPNVPKHIANPENPAVFDAMIDHARWSGAELILATDPDCDRLGCAVRTSPEADAPWTTLTGNQLGSLLTDFLLEARRAAGTLSADHYIVKTLVTTELMRRIADAYGVQTAGDLHVGFKWIGREMDLRGPEKFIFGAEESYGFLAGDHVRDKDGATAALLTAELAAKLKEQGQTLYQKLDALFRVYGCFSESQINVAMPGQRGMEDMRALMAKMRSEPPRRLGGLAVVRVRDYFDRAILEPDAASTKQWQRGPFDGPAGDMVILDLEREGNYTAVRPSGTEPKVKFYLFAYDPPGADLQTTKKVQAERLEAIGADLRAFAGV